MRSRVSSGSRSGCRASPRRRRKQRDPHIVSIRCLLLGFGDGRKEELLPRLLRENMADHIVLVQPLHDYDDGAVPLVVLPAVEGVIVPFVSGISLRAAHEVASGHVDQKAVVRHSGTDGLQTRRWREMDSNLYGAFPVK